MPIPNELTALLAVRSGSTPGVDASPVKVRNVFEVVFDKELKAPPVGLGRENVVQCP